MSQTLDHLPDKFIAGLHDEDTPVTKDYVKKRLDRLRAKSKVDTNVGHHFHENTMAIFLCEFLDKSYCPCPV